VSPVKLSKSDARRALVRHHFARCESQREAFGRLRSIQFDPIAPVGCNHDLVLQARVPGYKIGDWEKLAYEERFIYDGWDKQASLVPFEGWRARRIFHKRHSERFEKVIADHPDAVEAILNELREQGPLMPGESGVKERKEEWKSSWHGPNLSKQILRSLWHTGQVMTSGRRRGQHVYDLTERIVPPQYYSLPPLTDGASAVEVFHDRHRAIGFLRPTASYEVWSYYYAPERAAFIEELLGSRRIVPVDIEGMKAHATTEFLANLDLPSPEPRVVFVAPLDQLMWDRKLVQHLFDFDYVWEIYVPEPKRRWGYYVLPVLHGDKLVARAEFVCRKGLLELKQWHFEPGDLMPSFFTELEHSMRDFMSYCSATKVGAEPHIDRKIRNLLESVGSP
jgi:uncharacterized protein YcaQ